MAHYHPYPCPSVAGKAGSPASIRSRAPASGFAEPGVPPSVSFPPQPFARGLECSTGGPLTRPSGSAAALADELTRSWSPWLARGGQGEWSQSSRHGAAKASKQAHGQQGGPGLGRVGV